MISENKLKQFVKFLQASGAEILEPTNFYEAIRFRGNNQVGIIYTNRTGQVSSITGEAQKAYQCFLDKKPYSACAVKKRIKKNNVINSLLARDGIECFYCGNAMEEGKETLEHLLSIRQGGNNHICNLALSHMECNAAASHLSVVEKVKLREKLRRVIR